MRIFFGDFADKEANSFPTICTKKGIGFSGWQKEVMVECFEEVTKNTGSHPVVSDVSGWEKTFSLDLCNVVCCVMNQLNYQFGHQHINTMLAWYLFTLFRNPGYLDIHPLFPDEGALISFQHDKVQRSGNFLTTTSNGIGRSYLAFFVGSYPVSMGDDCCEWPNCALDTLKERYKALRLPLRDVEALPVVKGNINYKFCSHSFWKDPDLEGSERAYRCWLFAWERMIFEAHCKPRVNAEDLENYTKELEEMPNLPDFTDVDPKVLIEALQKTGLADSCIGHESK